MDITLLAAIGTTVAAVWSIVAVVVSVVVGRSIAIAEERETDRLAPVD